MFPARLSPCVVLLTLCPLLGCDAPPPDGSASTTTSKPATSATGSNAPPAPTNSATSSADAAPSSSVPVVGSAAPSVAAPSCVAKGSSKPQQIAARMGRTVMMRWSGDRFFLLTKTLSKSEIAAVHIDGSAATVVATVEGEATSIAADDASVYFTVAETLYRVPRSGGEVQKVAAPFGYDVVLDDQRAYAIGFDKKDVVVRSIAKSGGEVTTLVRRTMTGTREPYFRRIAVQGERLYFSDKDTRVLVEVSKRDGSILRTDDDVGLVSELVVTPTSAFLTYEPNGELRRIDLATGKKERITSNHGGLNAIGSHDIYMWALCQEYPNSQPCPLYKRSLEGGEAVVVDNLRSNLEALAVDDECLYLVRQNDLAPLGGGEGVQTVVQAMAKP